MRNYYHMNVIYKNLGFLASHKGTDLQAIISACKSGTLQATPTVIISNNSHSGAIIKAKRERIPFYNLSANTHPIPEELDLAILNALVLNKVDLVILAGYDRKLGIQTLTHYDGRVINIHPSLLPKHGGAGMYGIRVHQAVLEAGETDTGISIHLIDKDYDRGRIIAQTRVAVLPSDTAESLSMRVLEREHSFFVETIGKILNGEISL